MAILFVAIFFICRGYLLLPRGYLSVAIFLTWLFLRGHCQASRGKGLRSEGQNVAIQGTEACHVSGHPLFVNIIGMTKTGWAPRQSLHARLFACRP